MSFSDGALGFARLNQASPPGPSSSSAPGAGSPYGSCGRDEREGVIKEWCLMTRVEGTSGAVDVMGELDEWGKFIVSWSQGYGTWGVITLGSSGQISASLMPFPSPQTPVARLTGAALVSAWAGAGPCPGVVMSTSDGYLHHYRLAASGGGGKKETGAKRERGAAGTKGAAAGGGEAGRVGKKLESAVFEKCVCLTGRVRVSGEVVLSTRAPPSGGVGREGEPPLRPKSAAAAPPSEALVSAHADKLRLTLQNSNAEVCIIGVLVLVGDAFVGQIPVEIHVQDRVVETAEGVKRWYAVVLSPDEILQCDRWFE